MDGAHNKLEMEVSALAQRVSNLATDTAQTRAEAVSVDRAVTRIEAQLDNLKKFIDFRFNQMEQLGNERRAAIEKIEKEADTRFESLDKKFDRYLTKEEDSTRNEPTRKVVYGLVALIVTSVVSAVMALVIKAGGVFK